MKKFISVLLLACMVLTFSSVSAVFADDAKDYKFRAKLSSVAGDGTGSVTGTVFTDYSAELVFDGSSVNRSNFKTEVWMKNVESLGVSEEKYYVREAETGITGTSDVSMTTVKGYFNKIQDGTTVTGIVLWTDENDETTYSFSRGENDKIIATPDKNASTVWHDIVNDEYITTGDDTDSRFILKSGSWLQVGSRLVTANSDLTIDNISDYSTNETNARAALSYKDDNEEVIKVIKILLKAGTRLTLGTRYAELKKDMMITIDVGADGDSADVYDDKDFEADLDRIWASHTKNDYINAVLTALQNLTNGMGGKNNKVMFGEEEDIVVEPHPEENFFTKNTDNKDVTDDAVYTYTVSGHTVTVTCDTACKIGYKEGDEYVAIKPSSKLLEDKTNKVFRYQYEVPDGINLVILVLNGDTNMSGDITTNDSLQIILDRKNFSRITDPIKRFAADTTFAGDFTTNSAVRIEFDRKNVRLLDWE